MMKVEDVIRLLEGEGWFLVATRARRTNVDAPVVIEKANGNYSAYVPDLPGCVATGDTVAAVENEIREAIRFHIDGLQADGIVVPQPTSIAEYVET